MAAEPESEREVRIGLVLYGGVSLAIYIYGVAYELQRLVRASEGAEVNAWTEVLKAARAKATVDIVSGASAGGINGLLLGKALTSGADLRAVRSLWIDEADLGNLLRDAGEKGPKSLLRSDRFRQLLGEGLAAMDQQSLGKPLVRVFDLFIAATRIRPWVREFPTDLGGLIQSSQYRKSFDLKYRQRGYNPEDPDGGYAHDDFSAAANPMLADIAQVTSAFPVAFEPVEIEIDAENRHLFSAAEPSGYFFDGGVLHNKPFTETVSTILTRAAWRPVRRWLVSVEPDPEHALPPSPDAPAPEVTEVAAKAVVGIPRYQSTGADLTRLREHRERAAKARERLDGIDESLLELIAENLALDEERLEVAGYEQGRWYSQILTASDYWEERRRRFRAASIERLAQRFPEPRDRLVARIETAWEEAEDDHLEEADADYERRRVYHLLEMARPLRKVAEAEPLANAELATAQRELWAQFDRIEDALWNVFEKPPRPVDPLSGDIDLWVAVRLQGLAARLAQIREDTRAACVRLDALWAELVDAASPGRFTTVYDWFELWDVQLLTIAELSDAGARDEILLARISPADARFIQKPPAMKLAGDALGHFGGFLKREWRANDVLWGRLDAAETISRILMHDVAEGGPRVEAQIRHAQEQIVREELPDVSGDYRNHMENVHSVGAETLADVSMEKRAGLSLQAGEVLRNMFATVKDGNGPNVLRSAFGGLGRILGFILLLLRWPVRGIWGLDPAWRRIVSVAILLVGFWAIATLVLIALSAIGTTSTLWVLVAGALAVFLIWSGLQALFR